MQFVVAINMYIRDVRLRAVNLETGKMRHFYDDDDVVCINIVVATKIEE